MRMVISAALGAGMLAACSPNASKVEETAAPAFERIDYADLDTWLCHPDKAGKDACAQDLTATVIAEDGSTQIEMFAATTEPAFDCFYYYPTVSLDQSPNSDMLAGPEELSVTANQFARYGSACRLYAPIYRQATLMSLRAAVSTGTATADAEMRWADIVDSWKYYLEHENNGRGVVLVGHSQGAGMILELLKKEIIGTPAQDLLIAAHPIGTLANVDADGTFGGMPVCASADKAGCMLSFVSFRATAEPPAESRFGKVTPEGNRAICSSPPALSGDGTALDAYLPRASAGVMANADYGVAFDTPFVKLPGLLSAECRSIATHDWLAVTINAGDGPRTDDIVGDIVNNGEILADWGLHYIDVNLVMGHLPRIAAAQAAAWEAGRQGE
ncbi:MAG TPA: DUF3089 domain-containing protein [Hyphomonas sp.]|nr:lysophospholipase [Hyphomonas sp.]HRJ01533.1 DUF3089 domain-containing protein [Hyphomonas sp.]